MSRFHITTHTVNASHLREYPRGSTAAAINPPTLKLVVNQYTPRPEPSSPPSAGDVSIVFCHANGISKELYEPFFDDLLAEYTKSKLRIRSIWAPDAANQGASGVVNESLLGDDPCWNDFSRDVLHMVNQFSTELQPPIIGMGHSFGGHAIAQVSLMHPSLFTALVFFDPIIEESGVERSLLGEVHPSVFSAKRRDIWPSMEEAASYIRLRPFYRGWDQRVTDRYLKHGFRPLPTLTYPNIKSGVTLTTPKHQEVLTFIRHDKKFKHDQQLGRAEPTATFKLLQLLAPPLYYVVGENSRISAPKLMEAKMRLTPLAETKVIEGAGHMFPLESPTRTAESVAPYMVKQVERWKEEAERDQATPRHRGLTEDFLERLSHL